MTKQGHEGGGINLLDVEETNGSMLGYSMEGRADTGKMKRV